MKKYNYCQRQIEGKSKCTEQCDHCKEYYAPLEDEIKNSAKFKRTHKDVIIQNIQMDDRDFVVEHIFYYAYKHMDENPGTRYDGHKKIGTNKINDTTTFRIKFVKDS